jgi:phage gp29-like protein
MMTKDIWLKVIGAVKAGVRRGIQISAHHNYSLAPDFEQDVALAMVEKWEYFKEIPERQLPRVCFQAAKNIALNRSTDVLNNKNARSLETSGSFLKQVLSIPTRATQEDSLLLNALISSSVDILSSSATRAPDKQRNKLISLARAILNDSSVTDASAEMGTHRTMAYKYIKVMRKAALA